MSCTAVVTKRIKKFELITPTSLQEAISFLRTHKPDGVKVMAGGTDLLILLKNWEISPKYIISMKKIEGLDYVRVKKEEIKIGAFTKISTIMEANIIRQAYYSMFEAIKNFATTQIRNMATIGGNICRSSPAADLVCSLISFDSQVKLSGIKGDKIVALERFFTGPGTNILNDEILTEIIIPKNRQKYGTAFEKITRSWPDCSKVNCAVKINISDDKCLDPRIVLGAVASRPIRATKTEKSIKDKKLNDKIIENAGEIVASEISPITDVRSTIEYRKEISKYLVKKLIKIAYDRAKVSN